MWQNLIALVRMLWTQGRNTEQNAEDIKELQTQMHQMMMAMQQVATELRHLRELQDKERDNLLLKLENELLRFERRLPSGEDKQ